MEEHLFMVRQVPITKVESSTGRLLMKFVRKYWVPYVLVLPAIVVKLAFTGVPLLQTVWLSFTDKTITRPGTFCGLQNFAYMLEDSLLKESVGFTVIYSIAATQLELLVGLGIALLVSQKLRGRGLAQTAMLLPWAAAPMVAAMIGRLLFFEAGGVLNDLVLRSHLSSTRVPWLSNPTWAGVSVIATTVWKNSPWAALLSLAGLKSVPREFYEAAEVDGAGPLQRFRYITLPLITPVILVILMLRGMAEIQTFEQILGLTRGGPGTATQVISLYAYERFFLQFRYGYGSALMVVLLLLTVLVGGSFMLLINRRAQRY